MTDKKSLVAACETLQAYCREQGISAVQFWGDGSWKAGVIRNMHKKDAQVVYTFYRETLEESTLELRGMEREAMDYQWESYQADEELKKPRRETSEWKVGDVRYHW